MARMSRKLSTKSRKLAPRHKSPNQKMSNKNVGAVQKSIISHSQPADYIEHEVESQMARETNSKKRPDLRQELFPQKDHDFHYQKTKTLDNDSVRKQQDELEIDRINLEKNYEQEKEQDQYREALQQQRFNENHISNEPEFENVLPNELEFEAIQEEEPGYQTNSVKENDPKLIPRNIVENNNAVHTPVNAKKNIPVTIDYRNSTKKNPEYRNPLKKQSSLAKMAKTIPEDIQNRSQSYNGRPVPKENNTSLPEIKISSRRNSYNSKKLIINLK